MLKSTHKPNPTDFGSVLPQGWTEHISPAGHTYYYNKTTEVSTYTRPYTKTGSADASPDAHNLLAYEGTPIEHGGFPSSRAFGRATNEWHAGSREENKDHRHAESRYGTKHGIRRKHRDRPKMKQPIPGCEPWELVHTRLGRRFVFHPERNESFWKFPPDVLEAVVQLDRLSREKRQKRSEEPDRPSTGLDDVALPPVARLSSASTPGTSALRARDDGARELQSDEEYEEIEVEEGESDNDNEPKLKNDGIEASVEFDEDDIAHQLREMGHDVGSDAASESDDVQSQGSNEAGAASDNQIIFKAMLDDHHVNPYSTWEALIDAGNIVDDERYLALPNMRSRKDAWSDWTRDKIQLLKQQKELQQRQDPKLKLFSFLQAHATPKLYWPEFRRKYQKEPVMRDSQLSDKAREKWYREHINRLKFPESRLKADLLNLLEDVPLRSLNRATLVEHLPSEVLSDIRFISLKASTRDTLIASHIAKLPDLNVGKVTSNLEGSGSRVESSAKFEQALAERQQQVENERRKHASQLRYSKDMLRDGEEEVKRAMNVGKQGLLGHKESMS